MSVYFRDRVRMKLLLTVALALLPFVNSQPFEEEMSPMDVSGFLSIIPTDYPTNDYDFEDETTTVRFQFENSQEELEKEAIKVFVDGNGRYHNNILQKSSPKILFQISSKMIDCRTDWQYLEGVWFFITFIIKFGVKINWEFIVL